MMIIKIGDIVRHKTTGITGKVIGYGERISDRYHSNTLIVELRSDIPIAPIAEDVVEKWKLRQDKRISACTLPYFPKPSIQAKSALV